MKSLLSGILAMFFIVGPQTVKADAYNDLVHSKFLYRFGFKSLDLAEIARYLETKGGEVEFFELNLSIVTRPDSGEFLVRSGGAITQPMSAPQTSIFASELQKLALGHVGNKDVPDFKTSLRWDIHFKDKSRIRIGLSKASKFETNEIVYVVYDASGKEKYRVAEYRSKTANEFIDFSIGVVKSYQSINQYAKLVDETYPEIKANPSFSAVFWR